MNGQNVTLKEAMQITIGLLENIRVPVSMIRDVGAPIETAVGNLRRCLAAMQEPPSQDDIPEAETEEEPE